MEILRQGVLRDVIFRRAKTARDNQYIGRLKRTVEGRDDGLASVANREFFGNGDAYGVEFFAIETLLVSTIWPISISSPMVIIVAFIIVLFPTP